MRHKIWTLHKREGQPSRLKGQSGTKSQSHTDQNTIRLIRLAADGVSKNGHCQLLIYSALGVLNLNRLLTGWGPLFENLGCSVYLEKSKYLDS